MVHVPRRRGEQRGSQLNTGRPPTLLEPARPPQRALTFPRLERRCSAFGEAAEASTLLPGGFCMAPCSAVLMLKVLASTPVAPRRANQPAPLDSLQPLHAKEVLH